MRIFQTGDRVFHVGSAAPEGGTVVGFDERGEVVVAWDGQYHPTETHPATLLRLLDEGDV